MFKAMELPLGEDLRPFLHAMFAHGIPVLASEEGDHQALWVDAEDDAARLRVAYAQYRAGALRMPGEIWAPAAMAATRGPQSIPVSRYPLTMLLLVASVLITAVIWFSGDPRLLALLVFEPVRIADHEVVGLLGVEAGLQAGEYWRLVTPVFLHFGWLHLVFNMLWLWELGRRIEMRRGSLHLGVLVLLTGVASNMTQYAAELWSGERALFGGMSGVIYALIGYITAWNLLQPRLRYDVPRGLFVVMIGMLLLCMSGLLTLAGFGQIANAAHIGGLVAGLAAGFLVALAAGRNHGH
jgi:GlpG protein